MAYFKEYRKRLEERLAQTQALGQNYKPFVDIKTGLRRDMDSREGSLLAQAPNSGVALDPNKNYVMESPDGTDIQRVKGSDSNAYKLLQQGWDIQNNTFFDEVDSIQEGLSPDDPNTPFIGTFLRSATDSALFSAPTITAALGKDHPLAQQWLSKRHGDIENIGAELTGGVAGGLATALLTRGAAGKGVVARGLGKVARKTGLLKVVGQSKVGRLLLQGSKTKVGSYAQQKFAPLIAFSALGAMEAELQEAYDPETNTFDLNTGRFSSYMAFGAGIGLAAQMGFKALSKAPLSKKAIDETLKRNPALADDLKSAKSGSVRQALENFVLHISSKEGRSDLAFNLRKNSYFQKEISGKTGRDIGEMSDDALIDTFISYGKEKKLLGTDSKPWNFFRTGLFKVEKEKEVLFNTLEKKNITVKSSELIDSLKQSIGGGAFAKQEGELKRAISTLRKQNIDGSLDKQINALQDDYLNMVEDFIGSQEGGESLLKVLKNVSTYGEVKAKGMPEEIKTLLNTKKVKERAMLKNLFLSDKGDSVGLSMEYTPKKSLEKLDKAKKRLRDKSLEGKKALKGRATSAAGRKNLFDKSDTGKKLKKQVDDLSMKIKENKRLKANKDFLNKLTDDKEKALGKYNKAQARFSNKYLADTNRIKDKVALDEGSLKGLRAETKFAEIQDVEIPIGEFYKTFRDYIRKSVPKDLRTHEQQRNIHNIAQSVLNLLDQKASSIPKKGFSALEPVGLDKKIGLQNVDYRGVKILDRVTDRTYRDIKSQESFFKNLLGVLGGSELASRLEGLPNEYWMSGVLGGAGFLPGGALALPSSLISIFGLKHFTKKDRIADFLYNKSVLQPQKLSRPAARAMRYRQTMKLGTEKPFTKKPKPLWDSAWFKPRFYYHLGEALKRATDPVEAYTEFGKNLYDSVNTRQGDTFQSLQESNKFNNHPSIFGEELSNSLTAAGAAVSQTVAKQIMARMPKMQVNEETGKVYLPPQDELKRFSNELLLIQNPSLVYEKIQRGTLLPSDVGFVKTVMPDIYESISEKLNDYLASNKKADRKLVRNINVFLKSKVAPGTTISGGINSLTTGALEESDDFIHPREDYKLPKEAIPGRLISRSGIESRPAG